MNKIRVFGLVLFCLALVATNFAQEKEISKEDYFSSTREARQKSREFNRTVLQTSTYTDKGVEEIDEWRYDYVLPDKIHYTNTRTFNGKVRRTEQINIGKLMYCKNDEGVWRLVESFCIGGGASGSPTNVASDNYYLEKKKIEGKDIKVLRNYVEYTNTYSPNKDTEGLTFSESIFWIDSKGLLTREENKSGLINTGKVKKTILTTYTYNQNLKIEAPIKVLKTP